MKEKSRECDLCAKKYMPSRRPRSKFCSDYCARRSGRIREYGLTNAEFRSMVRDRKCVLCRRKMTLREYNIDHDHATGETFGAVCSACNMMLAVIRRNPITAFYTIEYLTAPPVRLMRGEPVIVTEALAKRVSEKKPKKNSSFRRIYK